MITPAAYPRIPFLQSTIDARRKALVRVYALLIALAQKADQPDPTTPEPEEKQEQ